MTLMEERQIPITGTTGESTGMTRMYLNQNR